MNVGGLAWWSLALLGTAAGLDLVRRVLHDWPAIVRWWRR